MLEDRQIVAFALIGLLLVGALLVAGRRWIARRRRIARERAAEAALLRRG